jgi:Zn-finger nucleic acid-binding protein
MILACPTCDGRYDLTGYLPGQQFRCRCGTVMTLEAESTQAGLLACPQCAAGVSPSASACSYCSTELLLKACPRCLSRVFHGHKHCPECGAELDRVAAGSAHADMPCPRCETHLRPRLVGDLCIDECPGCRGLFLDHVAIKRIVIERQQARADALLGALPKHAVQEVGQQTKMYLKCPTCRVVMNRKQFAAGAGVIIDVCKTHGTFFDVGELPQIIEFVREGGLEKAERREIERMREAAKREQANAQYAMMMASHSSTHAAGERNHGTALIDLLSALWR